ncbi:MAG: hypothetical protein D6800_00350, partial [Candidatus Zixiibacteriota bacterium]
MKRIPVLFALTLLLVFAVGNVFAQQQVVVDNVTNTFVDTLGNPAMVAGQPHQFQLRVRNLPAAPCDDPAIHWNTNNAFRISSPDGATWNFTIASITPAFDIPALGWTNFFVNHFNDGVAPSVPQGDGQNTNEVQYGGVSFSASAGLPVGFDDIAYQIDIQSNLADVGKSICIDTIGVPPMGTFLWAGLGHPECDVSPEWINNASGDVTPPYCWIVEVPPNFPPDFTTCPVTVTGSHCNVLTADLAASDPEGDPITFSLVSGPGTITDNGDGTATWSYAPTLADVGASLTVEVEAADPFGNSAASQGNCIFSVNVTNEAPVITCPVGSTPAKAG